MKNKPTIENIQNCITNADIQCVRYSVFVHKDEDICFRTCSNVRKHSLVTNEQIWIFRWQCTLDLAWIKENPNVCFHPKIFSPILKIDTHLVGLKDRAPTTKESIIDLNSFQFANSLLKQTLDLDSFIIFVFAFYFNLTWEQMRFGAMQSASCSYIGNSIIHSFVGHSLFYWIF